MPKETVYDESGMYDAVVGWEADKYVQVGVKSHDGRPIAELLAAGGESPTGFTGLWGTFDRPGINRLIKALRHARDAAYGRDE